GQAFRFSENLQAFEKAETDGLAGNGDSRRMNDLRVTDSLRLDEILQFFFDRSGIEGGECFKAFSKLRQKAGRLGGCPQTLEKELQDFVQAETIGHAQII